MKDKLASPVERQPRSDANHSRKCFSRASAVAARLGISTKTVHRWAEAKKLSSYKINDRVVLFDEDEIDALVESARV